MTPFGSILTTFPTNLLHSTHASNNLPDDIHLFPSFSDYTGDTIARYRWNICIAIDEDRDNIFRSGNGTSGEVSAGRREVRENNEVHRPITRYLSPLIGWDLLWALLRTVFRRYCAIRLKFSIFPRFSAKSVVTTAKRPKRSKRIPFDFQVAQLSHYFLPLSILHHCEIDFPVARERWPAASVFARYVGHHWCNCLAVRSGTSCIKR